MNEIDLKARVKQAISQSVNGYTDSDIQQSQDQALDYYYGRPYGNEIDGSSSVVTREVMEVIDWEMPSLLRVFVSGDRVVEFKPVGPEDEEQAQQESDVVNHTIMEENDGFLIFHDWFKDALLQKNGYVKVYWDEEEDVKTETYENLDDFSLAQLLDDDEVEPVEYSPRVGDEPVALGMAPMSYHDIKIKRTKKMGRIVIENLPPEEVKVSRTARSIIMDDLDLVCHEAPKKASDLIEMGYSKELVDTIPTYDTESTTYDLDDARSYHDSDEDLDDPVDDSMREVLLSECYLRIDYDGDGVAEYRRVLLAGDHVLENEEFDSCPIVCLTPNRMPHKHTGMSDADKVMDLQLINSTIIRAKISKPVK